MCQKRLEINNFSKGARSYVDCLYALLTSAGLFHLPKYMLSGMTGMAFKFVIHRRLLPSSLDLYSWQEENWQAVNSLGIYNETYTGSPMNATFPLYQKNMLHKIISSIDDGKAVIGWEIERPIFCLYTGYNKDEEILFYRNSIGKEEDVLLFDNLGLISEGHWFVQILGDSIENDIRDIFLESLECAVREWNTEYKINPNYGSGKRAYQNLLDAFQSKDFNIGGAYYILEPYIDIKSEISSYMDEVIKELPGLADVSSLYHKLAATLLPLKQIKLTGNYNDDLNCIPEVAKAFWDAMIIEDKAIKELEKYLMNYINNRSFNPSRLRDIH